MAVIVGVPMLSRKVRIPAGVGLMLGGILIGPFCLDLFGENRPIADFFAELGKLLLMFGAGLEIDMAVFRRERKRAVVFGFITTLIPLLLGTVIGLLFCYQIIPAIVLGSLLASHTLLGFSTITRLGKTSLAPIIVTAGATILSDTLSLLVFAICVPIYKSGFSLAGFAIQLVEVLILFPLALFGLSRLGAVILRKVKDDEDAYFVMMLAILGAAGILAESIQLPGIVGAFLAGLAVNASARETAAKEKLKFFGKAFFIPIFFVVTGFLIEPVTFFKSITGNFPLVISVVGALVAGKWIAAQIAGKAFAFSPDERKTIWSLTLPQVAATLAAALVAYNIQDRAGNRLIDTKLLNVVFVLVLVTSILGPILTERFAPSLHAECEK